MNNSKKQDQSTGNTKDQSDNQSTNRDSLRVIVEFFTSKEEPLSRRLLLLGFFILAFGFIIPLIIMPVVFFSMTIPLKLTSVIVPGVHIAGIGFVASLILTVLALPFSYGLRLKAVNLYNSVFTLPIAAALFPEIIHFDSIPAFLLAVAVFESLAFGMTYLYVSAMARVAKKKLRLGFNGKNMPSWFYTFSLEEPVSEQVTSEETDA
ncbi:MAG: hypothetical protein K2X81_20925 [Candidatus Obscuribacterales bacterium]|nr:hypothetical protein [Candidatus Obscuribacterales bacterium]